MKGNRRTIPCGFFVILFSIAWFSADFYPFFAKERGTFPENARRHETIRGGEDAAGRNGGRKAEKRLTVRIICDIIFHSLFYACNRKRTPENEPASCLLPRANPCRKQGGFRNACPETGTVRRLPAVMPFIYILLAKEGMSCSSYSSET